MGDDSWRSDAGELKVRIADGVMQVAGHCQAERDRDELVAALEAMLNEHDDGAGDCPSPSCQAKRALLARIKAGGR